MVRMERDITKKIIHKIKDNQEKNRKKLPPLEEGTCAEKKNILTEFKKVVNNAQKQCGLNESKTFPITKKTPQFGDVRISQEEEIFKTIGERVEIEENGLVYKADTKSLELTGKISALNVAFRFCYNDPSGEGCYVWANKLQLTDANQRTIGKIYDAYENWKEGLNQNGDLLEKLEKAASQD